MVRIATILLGLLVCAGCAPAGYHQTRAPEGRIIPVDANADLLEIPIDLEQTIDDGSYQYRTIKQQMFDEGRIRANYVGIARKKTFAEELDGHLELTIRFQNLTPHIQRYRYWIHALDRQGLEIHENEGLWLKFDVMPNSEYVLQKMVPYKMANTLIVEISPRPTFDSREDVGDLGPDINR
jgi:hypothetical protein